MKLGFRVLMTVMSIFVMAAVVGIMPDLLAAKDGAGGEPACSRVEIYRVVARDMARTVKGVGTLEADQKAVITTEVAGKIENILFQEGTAVEEGQLLLEIEKEKLDQQYRAARAGVKEAEATLKNARRTFDRQQTLYKQNLTSKDARDKAETALETAAARLDRLQAELAAIKDTLQDARVRAPFSGTIAEQMVDEGNWVNVGTPLTTLVKTDRLEIAFSLPERYLPAIKPGQTAEITAAAVPDQRFSGQVFFVSPQINESTRSFLVKAAIDNTDRRLTPGGFVSVAVTVDVHTQVPVIPEEALIPTRTGYQVFLVQDGVARLTDVTPGLRIPGWVEIADGLAVGQQIVQTGHISLHNGSRVCAAGDNKTGGK